MGIEGRGKEEGGSRIRTVVMSGKKCVCLDKGVL